MPIVVRADKCVNHSSVAPVESESMDLGEGSDPFVYGSAMSFEMRRNRSVLGI
jgi:hypothetical protein